jgi:adenosine kinase
VSKKILVTGSIAFDTVFRIRGTIQDEIIISNGRLGKQNMMFTAEEKRVFFGGTGANISYGLGLLGAKPLFFSVAGKDYKGEYEKHLKRSEVQARVFIDKEGYTANFIGMSDERDQQLGVFQPNAYRKIQKISLTKLISKKELKQVSTAICAAGTQKSMYQDVKIIRENSGEKAIIIFDPGQNISIFYDKKLLEKTLHLSNMVIGNEAEIIQLKKILGYDIQDIFPLGPSFIIETYGEKGSVVYGKDRNIHIKAVSSKKVKDPTGAGDAYRAGLLFGLSKDLSLGDSCKFGSILATQCIKSIGAQQYKIPAVIKKLTN